MNRTFANYIRIGVALAGATALAFGLNQMREAPPTIIKTYTENEREITLLDYDGDLSTVEERVTRGRFSAFGSEPPVDGYTEKREFEPPVEKDGRKTNTEVSFYGSDGKRVGGIVMILEPREGRLEIPEEKPSVPEVEESSYERIRGYLERVDFSQLELKFVDDNFVRFEYGSPEEGNKIWINARVDRDLQLIVPTETEMVFYYIDIDKRDFSYSGYNLDERKSSGSYSDEGSFHRGKIEGDDIVIERVRRHCIDPPIKKDSRNNHKSLHEYDDLEVGQRLPGLGKKAREIYEAFNEKAKEAVEKQKE